MCNNKGLSLHHYILSLVLLVSVLLPSLLPYAFSFLIFSFSTPSSFLYTSFPLMLSIPFLFSFLPTPFFHPFLFPFRFVFFSYLPIVYTYFNTSFLLPPSSLSIPVSSPSSLSLPLVLPGYRWPRLHE